MRKIKNMFLTMLILTLGYACQDWLDVKPKSEIKSDVLFETENGFKDALVGTYLLMGDQSIYGMELTVGFMDVIARQYELGTSSNAYYQIAQWDYTSSKSSGKIANIWAKMYNTIANLNNILGNIDRKREIMHPTNYGIIKGECLGLRAFLHLDLLRMFGYGDLERNPGNLDKTAIPYADQYSKHIPAQLTEKEVLEKILADLEVAQELLDTYDPWGISSKEEDYNLPNEDKFYSNRHRRFNYFAVRATQARAWLWMGEYAKALSCAGEVIRYGQDSLKWNANFDVTDPANRDMTCTSEYIFGLNTTGLFDQVKPFLVQSGVNVNTNLFYHTKTKADLLFETAAGMGSDYRYRWLYDQSTTKFTFFKFYEVENYRYANSMPLIRKPEMYYIAAECLNHTGNADDRVMAIQYLNTVREKRNISRLGTGLTQAEVTEEIRKEYMKEFLCEGQMFYYYKRTGATHMQGQPVSEVNYKLPLPDVEVEFGGRN